MLAEIFVLFLILRKIILFTSKKAVIIGFGDYQGKDFPIYSLFSNSFYYELVLNFIQYISASDKIMVYF